MLDHMVASRWEQNEIIKSSNSIPMRFVPVPRHCLNKRVREILKFTVFLILSEPVELNAPGMICFLYAELQTER